MQSHDTTDRKDVITASENQKCDNVTYCVSDSSTGGGKNLTLGSRFRQFLPYIPFFILITLFALGGEISRRRHQFHLMEYDSFQLEQIERGDHSASDSYIQNALYCYCNGQKALAIRQAEEVCRVDSEYWAGWQLLGVLHFLEYEYLYAIHPYQQSLELNRDNSVYVSEGGYVLSDTRGFYELACLYTELFKLTYVEYYAHFAEVCATIAREYDSQYKKEKVEELIEWLRYQQENYELIYPYGESQ